MFRVQIRHRRRENYTDAALHVAGGVVIVGRKIFDVTEVARNPAKAVLAAAMSPSASSKSASWAAADTDQHEDIPASSRDERF